MNSKGHSVGKLQVLVLFERRSIRNTVFSMDKIPSSGEYAKVHAHEKIRVGEWQTSAVNSSETNFRQRFRYAGWYAKTTDGLARAGGPRTRHTRW